MVWARFISRGVVDGAVNGDKYAPVLQEELSQTAEEYDFDLRFTVLQQDTTITAKGAMNDFSTTLLGWPANRPQSNRKHVGSSKTTYSEQLR